MTTQVFDNYFPPDYFYGLKNKVMEENFKWTFGTKLNDNQKNNNDTYFVQNIYPKII